MSNSEGTSVISKNLARIGLTQSAIMDAVYKGFLSGITVKYLPSHKIPVIGNFLAANPMAGIMFYGALSELEYAYIKNVLLRKH